MRSFVIAILPALLFGAAPALAWDVHRLLMPGIIESLPSEDLAALRVPFPGPCTLRDPAQYEALKKILALNPANELPRPESLCAPGEDPEKLLLADTLDEPDMGMDKDLPDSYDPDHIRQWMGGASGPSSQGFRHMYFGGWSAWHPITTLQVPLHAVGLAPERALFLANQGREMIRSGNVAWGWRVLGWAMHYIQDLAQPFHAVEIVSFRMEPWSDLFQWPPSAGFHALVTDSTRIVSNYHAALEGYVRESLKEKDSPFLHCLNSPEGASTAAGLANAAGEKDPGQIARINASASVALAAPIGRDELEVLGTDLMKPTYYLSHGQGSVDYGKILHEEGSEDFIAARVRFNNLLCAALANASQGSRRLIHWALEKP